MKKHKSIANNATQWRGQQCDVLSNQEILTSSNAVKQCCIIRIHGLELWKALRLVDRLEVIEAK